MSTESSIKHYVMTIADAYERIFNAVPRVLTLDLQSFMYLKQELKPSDVQLVDSEVEWMGFRIETINSVASKIISVR